MILSAINLWRILTIKFYTPTHRSISFALSFVVSWIFEIVDKQNATLEKEGIQAIGLAIVIISSLIYNEAIILNFCNLNTYTKEIIIQRGFEEDYKC